MIRRATEADMPELMRMAGDFHQAVRAYRWAEFKDSVGGWLSWFRACMAQPHLVCFVDDHEGRLRGMATALTSPAFWNPSVVTACETVLWVETADRKSGVGGALVEAIAEWSKERGACLVAAGSSIDLHPKAMGRMLMKHGFRLHERVYSRRVV